MKSIIKVYTFLVLTLATLCSYAQGPENNITISGTVKDSKGVSLEGVKILIQERVGGDVTSKDGKFSLAATSNDIIYFKKEGYNLLKIPAVEINKGVVTLTESLIDAGDDDDVFIPFGIRKKRGISASISTIKGTELPQLPLSTLTNSLSGRLAGLYIKQTGSRPGVDDASLLIRGRSSYNSGQSPLVLVDGVERDFVNMDLNEIEGISVLKDAASLSWYGMNGANGVVYITTKRGNAVKTNVTFDTQVGVQAPVNLTNPVNSFQFASLSNQVATNSGLPLIYDQTALNAYQSRADLVNFPDNNFVDRFIKDVAPVQRYVTTVSGGNSFARYFTLLSYYKQDGLYRDAAAPKYNTNSNFKRYNFRTNLDLHVNKKLDVRLDVGGRIENLQYNTSGNATFLNTIYNTPANAFPLLNPDGTFGGSALFRNNPLAMLTANGNNNDLTRSLLATLEVMHKLDFILNGLSANAFYTYDITSAYAYGFNENYEVYAPNGNGTFQRFGNQTPLQYKASDFNSNVRNNEFWTGIDYDRTFGLHNVKFSSRLSRAISAAPGRLDLNRTSIANRLSYGYNNRYFMDIVTTYAGSENFAVGKRFGVFPAFSAGWIISEENFLKKFKAVNFLKIRGSYGIVGADELSTRRFAFSNYFTRSSGGYTFGTGYTGVSGAGEVALANPNLTWEKAVKSSVGIDGKFFDQSLSLAFDLFREKRKDLLIADLLPNVIGQSLSLINNGQAQYQGYEATLSYQKTFNKVTVGFNGNFTKTKSKILKINEEAGIPQYQKQTGFSVGSVVQGGEFIRRFLVSNGLFQSQAEINAAPVQRFSALVRPGDIRYVDQNNDNVIDNLDFIMTNYSDVPDTYYGFGTSVRFANFDVSLQFQGVAGRTIQINNLINSTSASGNYINQFSQESWTPATAATAKYPLVALNNRGNNTQDSDFWLRSGDFLKLKNLELGYTISPNVIKKLKLNSLRFYASGFNLLTFSKLGDLPIDPEIPTAGFNSDYPYIITFSAGINLKF
ncbi:MAG: SusC/RagA family TonB-linked outer membrane protein [Flavobacterium sp.]|nr:SusC/RagA family TonB-linked outer membrane protein [Pedobacter sp.]